MALQPIFGLCIEVSCSHAITHKVGLLWTSDQPSQRPLPTQDNTKYRHKGQTLMPSAGFEPTITAKKRPQTYALDRAATGNGQNL
jgi:hypothetical protein